MTAHTFATTSPAHRMQRPGQWYASLTREGDELAGLVSVPLSQTDPVWLAAYLHLPPRWCERAAVTLRELAEIVDPAEDAYGPAISVGEFRVPLDSITRGPVEVGTIAEILGTVLGAVGTAYGGPVGGAAGAAAGGAIGGAVDSHQAMSQGMDEARGQAAAQGNLFVSRYRNPTEDEYMEWATSGMMRPLYGPPGSGAIVTERVTSRVTRQEYDGRSQPGRDAAAAGQTMLSLLGAALSSQGGGAGSSGAAQQLLRALGGVTGATNAATGSAGSLGALGALLGPLLASQGGGASSPQLAALLGALGSSSGGTTPAALAALLGSPQGAATAEQLLGAMGAVGASGTGASSSAASSSATGAPSSVPAGWMTLTPSEVSRLPGSARRWIAQARTRAARGIPSPATAPTPEMPTWQSGASPASSSPTLGATLARVLGPGAGGGDSAASVLAALNAALRGA